jgi:RNA methyltransferase, TrmH family
MLRITSRDNRRLKSACRVRDGKSVERIFIEGARLVGEALKSPLKLSEAFVAESFFASARSVPDQLSARDIPVSLVPDQIFASLAATKSSQGLILLAERPPSDKSRIENNIGHTGRPDLVIMLHEINNPANLGAILRTAEAAGAAAVITTEGSAGVFSPKALRGAMGAAFRLPVWENAGFDEALEWARQRGLKTVCADINAGKSYLEYEWQADHLLVFGSEAHGLSKAERGKIEESIYIPLENDVESLNLAVAAGIILFAAKRKSV